AGAFFSSNAIAWIDRSCEPKMATPSSVIAGEANTLPPVLARASSVGAVVLTRNGLRPVCARSTWNSGDAPGSGIGGGGGGGSCGGAIAVVGAAVTVAVG